MKTPILALTLLSLISVNSFADRPVQDRSAMKERRMEHRQEHRQGDHGMTNVTRTETRTNADGETASRTTTINRDPETKTVTRETNGQRFDGSTYSGTDVKQKTDDGYTRESTHTNAAGQTTSRSVAAVVDKEAGTVTKDITVVDKNGETHTRTIEVTRSAGEN